MIEVAEGLILNTLPLEYFLLVDVIYVSRQLHMALKIMAMSFGRHFVKTWLELKSVTSEY